MNPHRKGSFIHSDYGLKPLYSNKFNLKDELLGKKRSTPNLIEKNKK
jgi:hypothetical protein